MKRALEEVEASDSRTEEASEGDSLFDIMVSLDKEVGGESEGFTFSDICDVQIRCQKLYWRAWSVFLICHCVSRHSSYSFSFPFEE